MTFFCRDAGGQLGAVAAQDGCPRGWVPCGQHLPDGLQAESGFLRAQDHGDAVDVRGPVVRLEAEDPDQLTPFRGHSHSRSEEVLSTR
ncbi:hypothetical protein [Amycolatopsis sp. NPDC051102]|uniref:hypothetical protein n=1 Tax=Amycolatopsis sp. NPDC051102 TaxID=3155163 RepID=UPI00343810EF